VLYNLILAQPDKPNPCFPKPVTDTTVKAVSTYSHVAEITAVPAGTKLPHPDEQAVKNIKATVEATGGTMSDIVKANCYGAIPNPHASRNPQPLYRHRPPTPSMFFVVLVPTISSGPYIP
jgi:enamine deaminase RidA (YjgF/YER057c/UK114 family)